MKPPHAWTIAAVAGAASIAAVYWLVPARQMMPTPASAPAAQEPSVAAIENSAAPSVAPTPASPDDQQARLAFHARTRAFFAQAAALPADERAERAKAIGADVEDYERRGELSAGEALLLKIALIRESVADPTRQAQQIAALEDRYRLDTARRQAAYAAQRDPMFELYKLRESAIVTNVMAMSEIPDGLSRDEYLRQRLQSERELLLGGG